MAGAIMPCPNPCAGMIGACRGRAPSRQCSRARSACTTGSPTRCGCPSGPAAAGGVVILHGAGSCKENHHDFARAALGAGLAAIAFDQRGHGDSQGAMDGRALDDVVAIAALLRSGIGDPERRRSRCGLEHGRLPRDRVRRAAGAARGRRDLPGQRRGPAPRPRRRAVHVRRRRGRARRASSPRTTLARGGARARRFRCCCCTPRATSRCRSSTRASWRRCCARRGAG